MNIAISCKRGIDGASDGRAVAAVKCIFHISINTQMYVHMNVHACIRGDDHNGMFGGSQGYHSYKKKCRKIKMQELREYKNYAKAM